MFENARGLRGSQHDRLVRHTKFSATSSCAQHTTNMAKKVLCPVAVLVRKYLRRCECGTLTSHRGPLRVLHHDLWWRGFCRLVSHIVRDTLSAMPRSSRNTDTCRIGEISLMKDLTKTMEISQREMEAEAAAQAEAERAEAGKTPTAEGTGATPPTAATEATGPSAAAPAKEAEAAAEYTGTQTANVPPPHVEAEAPPAPAAGASTSTQLPPLPPRTSTPPTRGIPIRAAIMDKSDEEVRMEAEGMTDAEKELREKQKKKAGLTKEQREELAAYEMERKRIREERVNNLAKKLIERISLWTETDKANDVTAAFKGKIHLEIENLKMESFGIEILHAIGTTYTMKASSFLKSQKFLGISGFFSRIKDKGTLVKDTWSTMSAAIDAQLTMEEMAKLEEQGGEAWTDEKKAEYEKKVTGKILAAAWRGSKFEIQSVLRDVCDAVLNDKKIKLEKRVERAHALMIIGEMFQKVCLLLLSLFASEKETNIFHRLSAIPKKRATSWRLSSSWPRQQRRRMQKTRSTESIIMVRRKRRRRRKRHRVESSFSPTSSLYMLSFSSAKPRSFSSCFVISIDGDRFWPLF